MTGLSPIQIKLPNVVIGWREEAITFANKKNYHLIVNDEQRPFVHFFRYEDVKSNWYNGIFELGMKSKLPVPFDIQTIGMEDDKLKIITKENTKILVEFKFLHIFDLENCYFEGVDQTINDYIVKDYFDITVGSKLGHDIIVKPHDSFVKEFRTIRTNRVDRNSTGDFKDFLATSIIDAQDIKNFDYSDTIVRLLLERKIKQMKLKRNNKEYLKLSHSDRHISKRNFYFETTEDLDDRIVLHEP